MRASCCHLSESPLNAKREPDVLDLRGLAEKLEPGALLRGGPLPRRAVRAPRALHIPRAEALDVVAPNLCGGVDGGRYGSE